MIKFVIGAFIGFSVGFGMALSYLVEASDSSMLIKTISIVKGVLETL
ncbi:hypothetical protein CPT_Stills92 [Bacillus phage Stills]|uniref:Uncharacterized protein n=1 Tax=Bacillus phage Stills TaxID=1610833 RepID=A0A0E3T7Q9_9CAUD|nr:hypothetical protein CPT_Stills92 [Bacillus phage Stills]AKC02720.1 hypothetical protein CPT_Stills92 [Bacillus phage Stills]